MIKIAHISDLHIGSHQWGNVGRQKHHGKNLHKLADELKDYDIVMITGDVFDSPEPSPLDVIQWIYFCRDLKGFGAELIVNVGNHDMVVGSEYQWVETGLLEERDIHKEKSGDLHDTILGIKILNLSYIHKKQIKDVINNIPDGMDIIMMHQSAAGFLPSIARPQLDEEDLAELSKKCKYLALGDLHIHKIMKLSNGCTAAYPGTNFFLKLGEECNDFKFLEIQFDETKKKVSKIKSIPYSPDQASYVINLFESSSVLGIVAKDPFAFYIVRYTPAQEDEARGLVSEVNKHFPGAIIHLHRDKPPKVADSLESDSEVTEDTDFISLVEKENSLEQRDVDLVSEIWNNPSTDNIAAILEKDLTETILEAQTLHSK